MNKIQKEYQRKLRINQNNEVFTTFQRNSQTRQSPLVPKRQKQQSFHQTQHEHIESLKSTLKSIAPPSMELTKQFQRPHISSNNISESSIKNDQYMTKLSQLTKNLEEIASKCYFCPGNEETTRHRAHSDMYQKPHFENSQTISRYQPETFAKYSNNISVQLPLKSKSFLDKEGVQNSRSHTKSTHKQNSSLKDIKSNKDDKYPQTSSKKSFNKKEIISESIKKSSNSKNLAKIFDCIENSPNNLANAQQSSKSKNLQKVQTVFEDKVHRHKVTNILIADHIYTSSLDYTIKKIQEQQRCFYSEIVQKYREGIEHLTLINGKIFSGSRDQYIRSLDGIFFCKFDSIPVNFQESIKTNEITIGFKNKQLKLFDLNKRINVSSLQFETPFQMMNKDNKDLYVSANGALFAVDWRKKDFLINIYKDVTKGDCHWLSDPFSSSFWLESKGQITLFSPAMRKLRTKSLPSSSSFITHCWNRRGLYILIESENGNHLLRYDDVREAEQIDYQQSICVNKLLVREKQIIYGGKYGDLIIKQINK